MVNKQQASDNLLSVDDNMLSSRDLVFSESGRSCEKYASRDPHGLLAPPSVEFYLSTLHAEIERLLDETVRFPYGAPVRLTEAMRYALLAPGKRLRPIFVALATELCGGNRLDAYPACVALEAVHVYSLIHDDLPAMDDDDVRRGRPSCHKKFDEATAILAGDALLTFAFEVLTSGIKDAEIAARCVLELSHAAGACGMVGGQADDVLWSSVVKSAPSISDLLGEVLSSNDLSNVQRLRKNILPDFLVKIHRRKTGALFVAAVTLGSLCARASERQVNVLKDYAKHLGLTFQIADDLLDVIGDQNAVGKCVGKDKEAGKLTYVSLFGVEETKVMLAKSVRDVKDVLLKSKDIFDESSIPFKTALYLVDFVARRDR